MQKSYGDRCGCAELGSWPREAEGPSGGHGKLNFLPNNASSEGEYSDSSLHASLPGALFLSSPLSIFLKVIILPGITQTWKQFVLLGASRYSIMSCISLECPASSSPVQFLHFSWDQAERSPPPGSPHKFTSFISNHLSILSPSSSFVVVCSVLTVTFFTCWYVVVTADPLSKTCGVKCVLEFRPFQILERWQRF